ncbi:MAG: hypothetical protein IPK07_34445 [Deltaproteobacteria bacterium]|nr:hypothetical protein [Deltaproteobacteria bacterium]
MLLTITTHGRKRILANDSGHALLVRWWQSADAWLVGRYVILPDHLHAFVAPRRTDVSLPRWVRFWKAGVSREWAERDDRPLWQRDFWDTQLRAHQSYDAAWEYVCRNPVRAGLVGERTEWPYQGTLNVLPWNER